MNRKAKGNVTIKDETILAKKMSEHCYMIAQDVNHMLFTESVLDEILLSIPDDISAKEQIESADYILHIENGKIKDCYLLDDEGYIKLRNFFIQ